MRADADPAPDAAAHESLRAQLVLLRQPLLRFARMQLRNDSMAEDAVSETMLAILERPGGFAGRSSLRTYATGILKFKVIDMLRLQGRQMQVEPREGEDIDEALEALFGEDGHWQQPPPTWSHPERAFEQREFFAALEACIERLSPRHARVFMMREWLERDIGEICSELDITANNCHVMLHRARMLLRECLGRGWFGEQRC